MTITTVVPIISTSFDPYLLDPMKGIKIRMEKIIIPLSIKKLRTQDVGKKRDFDKLLKQFYEVYERKKIEKEKYETKIKNASKRSGISSQGGTCQFRRFSDTKQDD